MGDYAESLESSSEVTEADNIFSGGPADAALPERPQWGPEKHGKTSAEELLMHLGGLGTDRCALSASAHNSAASEEPGSSSVSLLASEISEKKIMPFRSAGRPAEWMVSDIVSQEPKAERSLMHRFTIALVHFCPCCAPFLSASTAVMSIYQAAHDLCVQTVSSMSTSCCCHRTCPHAILAACLRCAPDVSLRL